ncbi:hypothetical protein EDD76_10391 [Kineothrix alysoides]|uniref:Dolichyl-phosphate-mannose-protein mannosyltransferase n=1 Tax=Kineothrix alysoides TaxID=1469948 RepID=A0A4R1R3K8_9FIRM|nr:hypothetical protein [Kineothrix alysoides]TCL59902.1 hypothetical protein EDD76_10391 [Kineothrix alysoides]
MKMKKTWFSYLLWLLYMAITGILLATCIITISIYTWELSNYFAAACVCLFFAGVAGLWLAGSKIAAYAADRIPKDKHFANMWECFVAMCIFAGAVLYRIYYLLHAGEAVERNLFYEMAQVTDGGGIPNITHGASYVYTALLSAVFSFMGNKAEAGVGLQFVLQLLSMLFLYFGIRLLSGRVTALCATAFMAVSPAFVTNMFSLTPQGLYLLLYAAGLWMTGLYLRGLVKGGYRRAGSYFSFLLLGIYIGMISYLDILGITLFFFAGMCFVAVKGSGRGSKESKNIGVGIQFIVILIAALLTAAGIIKLDAVYSGQSFEDIAAVWALQYSDNIHPHYSIPGPDVQPVVSLVVCFIAALGAVGFLMRRYQKMDAWVLFLAALTAISFSGIGRMDYGIFAAVIWGTLAGLGLCSMGAEAEEKAEISPAAEKLRINEIEVEEIQVDNAPESDTQAEIVRVEDIQKSDVQSKAALEETVQKDDMPLETVPIEVVQKDDMRTEAIPSKGIEQSTIDGNLVRIESINIDKEALSEERGGKEEIKKEIKFIENPLPLPKKHVKKDMDYAIEVLSEQMDYDISPKENDDFDI